MNEYLKYINDNNFPNITSTIWNQQLPNGNYLVHYLADQNNNLLLEVIDKYPKLVLKKNTDGKYIHHILANKEYYSLLLNYLKKNINVIDILDNKNNHLLHNLVLNDSILKEIFILYPEVSINITNKNGTTPLLNSIIYKNFNSFKLLLENGALVTLPHNKETISTCILKTFISKLNLCKKWLELAFEYDEDLNIDNMYGEIPLHICYIMNELDTFDYLISKGADINYGGKKKIFLLFTLVEKKNWELIKKYYDLIDFNIKNLSLNTILHEYLKIDNNINEIKFLIETQNDLNSININGDTIFHLIKPELLLNFKKELSNKFINIWNKNSENKMILNIWQKNKNYKELIKLWKISLKNTNKELYDIVLKNGINNIKLNDKVNFIKVNKVDNNIYSAYIDNLILYLYCIIINYINKIFLPYKKKGLKFETNNFDSSEAKIIKYRLNVFESISSHLNCFIEYYNNDTYYCPKLPKKFPKNKISFYILSIINEKMNHTNIIIIDGFNNLIERFDPEGYNNTDTILDKWIIRLFRKYTEYKYYGICQYNKNTNLYQLLELVLNDNRTGDPVGYCSAWALWYLEMRLKNPKIHPEKLYYKSLKKIVSLKITIREYIRNYANNLVKMKNPLIKKILGKHNVNKDYLSESDNKKIKKYIDKQVKLKFT